MPTTTHLLPSAFPVFSAYNSHLLHCVQILYEFALYVVIQTNTFQGVIVTDYVYSYYAFSYTCGDIEWSGQGFDIASVGYNSHGDYFSNHPSNGFPDIGRIVSCTRRIIPQGGRMKRQADNNGGGNANEMPANEDMQQAIDNCLNRRVDDATTIMDVNGNVVDIVSMLPDCPRTRNQVVNGAEFRAFPEQPGCFRSIDSFIPDRNAPNPQLTRRHEFVSVCCYQAGNG